LIQCESVRLDKWLWFARLARSRAQAAQLCQARRLRLNGRLIEKPSATVRPGAVLSFAQDDTIRVLRVEAVGLRRGPAPEARSLYTDLAPLTATPAPA
jgi:ribosome-associated heat shock protein Hsp15